MLCQKSGSPEKASCTDINHKHDVLSTNLPHDCLQWCEVEFPGNREKADNHPSIRFVEGTGIETASPILELEARMVFPVDGKSKKNQNCFVGMVLVPEYRVPFADVPSFTGGLLSNRGIEISDTFDSNMEMYNGDNWQPDVNYLDSTWNIINALRAWGGTAPPRSNRGWRLGSQQNKTFHEPEVEEADTDHGYDADSEETEAEEDAQRHANASQADPVDSSTSDGDSDSSSDDSIADSGANENADPLFCWPEPPLIPSDSSSEMGLVRTPPVRTASPIMMGIPAAPVEPEIPYFVDAVNRQTETSTSDTETVTDTDGDGGDRQPLQSPLLPRRVNSVLEVLFPEHRYPSLRVYIGLFCRTLQRVLG